MSTETYYDRPVLKEPVWIWSVPAYFYSGGMAGAAATLGAFAQLHEDGSLDGLVRRCRRIAAAGTGAGTVFLILDLGRPERFLNMLRVFRPTSPLSMGSWLLAAAASLSAASALLPGKAAGAAGSLAGVAGLPLSGYTAVLLANTAVPVWRDGRTTLPALFVASAVSSAACALELLDGNPSEERVVHRLSVWSKLAELGAMSAVERETSRSARSGRALREGAPGAMWSAAKFCAAASLALSLARGRSRRGRRAAAILGTAAAAGVKFAVFYAGFASSRDPRATLESS